MRATRPDPLLSFWQAELQETPHLNMTMSTVLYGAARQWPEREALVCGDASGLGVLRWTYQELDYKASKLASGLLNSGYSPGDRIAVWGPNDPEWVLLEYAISRAGMVIVTLNPLYKRLELLFALQLAEVRGIFHAEEVGGVQLGDVVRSIASELPNLLGIHSFTQGIVQMMEQAPAQFECPEVNPNSLCMIQYTSGTTGNPKAAQISHNAIVTSALNSHRRYGVNTGDRVCHGFPLFHIGGSGCFTPGAALIGATSLPLRIFKSDRALQILEQERCRIFSGVPTMVIAMLEDPSFEQRDLSALEVLVIGGAPIQVEMLREWERRFGVGVINGYGQTETCGATSGTCASDPAEKRAVTSGVAMSGVSIKLVDKIGTIVPHGVRGELCYQGPGRMIGYRALPFQSEAQEDDDWLHSGDLATMDSQGFITIVGRVKDMIIRGGENLSPTEIEGLLLQHPAVSQVAVVGLPDSKYGEEVCAAIKLAAGSTVSAEELRTWCFERISRWKVPRYIVFIESLPLTPSGKVRKFMLKDQLQKMLLPNLS
ncbi:MAG: AMP-dependent synthetase [Gammaproteobacteria bacterium]|nr:AMP-dependent synthetase [Gammaproteobacteria bacterium]